MKKNQLIPKDFTSSKMIIDIFNFSLVLYDNRL